MGQREIVQPTPYLYERKLVFLFFFLLLLDGILRKWLLPSYSTPIMIVKQILAIYMVFVGYKKGLIKSGWATFSVVLGYISFVTTLLFGHHNLLIAFWGCQNWWFGIPLCIFISKVVTKRDLLFILRVVVLFSIINGIITALQYFSPITSFLNKQIGGELVDKFHRGTTISELGGMFRCSGIFGYITQSSIFQPLALGSILYFFFTHKKIVPQYNNYLLLFSILAYVLTCAFSISRTTIFMSLLSLGLILIGAFKLVSQLKNIFLYLPIFLLSISFVLTRPGVAKGIDTLNDRFEHASKKENVMEGNIEDLLYRSIFYTVEGIIDPKTLDGEEIPFWGFGQGISTQVGGRLSGLGKKNAGFAYAEWDSKRIICESGLLLGILILICRLGFVLSFALPIYKLAKQNIYLPLFLYPSFFFGFFFLNVWGNTFLFNFALLCGGLCLASIKIGKNENKCSIFWRKNSHVGYSS